MSIRSIRACDYPGCNSEAILLCPLCERDCCTVHGDRRWISWAVLSGTNATVEGRVQANSVGASKRIMVCSECQSALSIGATAPGHYVTNGPLNATMPPDGILIAAARAYIAEAKLKQS